MKKGWKNKTLAEVAGLKGRIGWKGLTAKEYVESGPLFLSVHSLNYGHFVDFRDAFHITKERYDESPEIMLKKGDILICKDGAGIGKLGMVGELPNKTTVNSSLLVIRGSEAIMTKYLYFSLLSPFFQKIVQDRLQGATTPHLYQRDIATFPIFLASLAEQEEIVEVLDKAFAAIDQAKANIEQNIANAKELFQSKLNQIFSQKGEDWVEQTLPDASVEFGRGKSKHRPRNAEFLYGGPYPFVQTGDIRNSDHTITSYEQTYSEEGLAQSKLWPSGTICITIAANIAETGILGFESCFPDSVIGMIPDPKFTSPKYVEYLLRFFKAELQAAGKGAAQDNINLGTFKNRNFPFAPYSQQKTIVQQLDDFSSFTTQLQASYRSKLTALDELKKSILQKAFAGELT